MRFAKLQARDQKAETTQTSRATAAAAAATSSFAGATSSSSTSAGPSTEQHEVKPRNDTLDSKYLIDLYPAKAAPPEEKNTKPEAFSSSGGEKWTEEDRSNYRRFMRDRERYHRTLLPALLKGREPDGSVRSNLAKLDIVPPQFEFVLSSDEKRKLVRDLNRNATLTLIGSWEQEKVLATFRIIWSNLDDKEDANEIIESIRNGLFTVDEFDELPRDVQQLVHRQNEDTLVSAYIVLMHTILLFIIALSLNRMSLISQLSTITPWRYGQRIILLSL